MQYLDGFNNRQQQQEPTPEMNANQQQATRRPPPGMHGRPSNFHLTFALKIDCTFEIAPLLDFRKVTPLGSVATFKFQSQTIGNFSFHQNTLNGIDHFFIKMGALNMISGPSVFQQIGDCKKSCEIQDF